MVNSGTQTTQRTGSRFKRFLVKGAIYSGVIYGLGVGVDYAVTDYNMQKDFIRDLHNKSDSTSLSLDQKLINFDNAEEKILTTHSLKWPYSVAKNGYHLGKDVFGKTAADTTVKK